MCNVKSIHAGSAGGATKRAVLKLLQQQLLKGVTSIIVYCTFQAQADEVARYLYTQGVSALAYHAGKSFKVIPTADNTIIYVFKKAFAHDAGNFSR